MSARGAAAGTRAAASAGVPDTAGRCRADGAGVAREAAARKPVAASANEDVAAQASADASAELRQVEALLVSRAYLYTLFHQLFGAAPTRPLLDELLGDEVAGVVGEYADDDSTMAGLCSFLGALAEREGRAALCKEARDEFTRLFVGPAELPALPWAAPWLTNEATFFQGATLEVRRTYRAHGWEPRRLLAVPDDHLALLCAFMARLSQEAAALFRTGTAPALAAALREQQAFVVGHLASWLPAFAAAVRRRSKTAVLYPQLIEAFAAFVQLDAVFTGEVAFWAESVEGIKTAQGVPCAASEMFAHINAAQKRLESMCPFGLEDYELVQS